MSVSGSLSQFQQAFAAGLWPAAAGPVDAASPVAALLAQPAFALYRNTVMKGCIDALEANYPAVARLVGSDWFRAAAALYVQAHPPGDARLVAYGAAFAAFLRDFEPAAELGYLPSVARLDRFWTEAHLAPDAEPLAPHAVARLDPERLAALTLAPHPAARWAWFDEQPIHAIWSRNRIVEEQEQRQLAQPAWHGEGALLTRPEAGVVWCEVDRADVAFLDACAAGEPLAAAADAALAAQPEADLSALFARLLGAGAFAADRERRGTDL